MIKKWVEDLVIDKTFIGLKFQEGILKRIAKIKNTTYRLSNPQEESKGIDGFIGNTPVSIKPTSYKTKNMLNEKIEVKIIYYEKKKRWNSCRHKRIRLVSCNNFNFCIRIR